MNHYPFRKFITSKSDLFEIIERVRDFRGQIGANTGRLICEMYRGHGRSFWKLESNIVRSIKDPKEIKKVEKNIITEFHEEINRAGLSKVIQKGFLNGNFHSDWLLLQQAQHFGVPTRFMDWTIDWEVALFFAVSNPADDDYDGHFWIYIVPPEIFVADNNESTYLSIDPFEFDKTIFLNPSDFLSDEYLSKIAQRRKSRQNGRFCIQQYEVTAIPLEEQEQHSENLHKVIIPNCLKKKIRENLADNNITNETLYVEEEANVKAIIIKLRKKYGV